MALTTSTISRGENHRIILHDETWFLTLNLLLINGFRAPVRRTGWVTTADFIALDEWPPNSPQLN